MPGEHHNKAYATPDMARRRNAVILAKVEANRKAEAENEALSKDTTSDRSEKNKVAKYDGYGADESAAKPPNQGWEL